jgi:hypothetical protein
LARGKALEIDDGMPLFGRPDGVRAERVPLVRRFMPFLMRRRNESAVWFEQDVDAAPALAFAESFSLQHGVRLTFFQLVLRSIARVLDEFPRLNRTSPGAASISAPTSRSRSAARKRSRRTRRSM